MPAGAEMDALIADKVLGWHRNKSGYYTTEARKDLVFGSHTKKGKGGYYRETGIATGWRFEDDGDYYACSNQCRLFCPSEDIVAAWEVVEKLCGHEDADEDPFRLRKRYSSRASAGEHWSASFLDRWHDNGVCLTEEAEATTAPLAICRAALLAVCVE